MKNINSTLSYLDYHVYSACTDYFYKWTFIFREVMNISLSPLVLHIILLIRLLLGKKKKDKLWIIYVIISIKFDLMIVLSISHYLRSFIISHASLSSADK